MLKSKNKVLIDLDCEPVWNAKSKGCNGEVGRLEIWKNAEREGEEAGEGGARGRRRESPERTGVEKMPLRLQRAVEHCGAA